MIIETVDPGVEGVREAVKEYVEKYPDFAQPLRMYGSIMEAQQAALAEIDCRIEMSDEEIEERLRSGKPLIDPRDMEIDAAVFAGIVGKICEAVEKYRPGGFTRAGELRSWEGIEKERLPETVNLVLAEDKTSLFADWDSEADRKIAQDILWESLAPFFKKYGSILCCRIEQSIWQRKLCPVCGNAPLMGKFSSKDGLWLVECALCHTIWNLQRASCAFCDESQGSLEYLYLEEDPEHRVQYCDRCRVYVKTVDLRDSGRDVVLPLEDIVTIELDLIAADEGLKTARDRQS